MNTSKERVTLRAEGLAVGYAGKRGRKTKIAELLDLELRAGEFVCLLGPNGVGKSTLIRSLAGMQKPLAGSIEIDDTPIVAMTPKERARKVSVVLTDSLPIGLFTAYSVVALGRHPHTSWSGGLGREDRDRIEWALQASGAAGLADRQVTELSDGERQKVMIARALAQEAPLMLLDEPTAFLDLPRRVEMMQLLRDLARKEGLSVLLSTHDLDLALRSADRLWLLGQGGEFETGVPEALALEGRIASAFRSDTLDWDCESGSFRLHRESCVSISLTGDGAEETWTRRALSRLGYEVVEPSVCPERSVCIEKSVTETFWVLRVAGNEERYQSLSSLIERLRTR